MITKLESVVPDGIRYMPAASYIDRAWPMIGRNRINELLRQRQVKVNGSRSETEVNAGDSICVYMDGKYDMGLRVVYDDGYLICAVKPAYLPVDVDENGVGEDTFASRLRLLYPDARPAHRLDAGTSGIMLAAVGDEAEAYITSLFSRHMLKKEYAAEVFGKMPKPRDTLKGWLVKDAAKSIVRVTDEKVPGALDITTIYTVDSVETTAAGYVSKLSVEIPTGRTHQIRAHLARLGTPLVGDDKYGNRTQNKLLGATRIRLECRRMTVDPKAEKYAGMVFSCPGK